MKRIWVRNAKKYLVVDDDVYEWAKDKTWFLNGVNRKTNQGGQRVCAYFGPNKSRKMKAISRIILNAPSELMVDHKNRNIFDNRRANLRLATSSQNQMNTLKKAGQQFKGAIYRPRNTHNKWMAQIRINQKVVCLGFYKTAKEAALIYDKAAKEHFGEFARINFE